PYTTLFRSMRCVGVRLADLWVAVLSSPDHLAGVRIECHQGRIGLLEKDLAVTEGEPSIHCVAAHDRYDARILLRLVLPLEGEVLQVDRIHIVRERRVYIHGIADDQR